MDEQDRPNIVRTLSRSGFLAPLRPDKYVRMGLAVRRSGIVATSGISFAAIRRPQGTAIIDELGSMTWRALDQSCDALATALQELDGGVPRTVGILCRNHRGIVQALAAANRIGADALLLNTSFAGPQLVEVVEREAVDLLVHDEEFDDIVAGLGALDRPPRRILAWTDSAAELPTIDRLVASVLGRRPRGPERKGRIVLLTSGTTGTPKGARRPSGGGMGDLVAVLDRIPWRAEEPVVVAAPIFHAWGFGQMVIAATMTCTVVTARRFDPEDTLRLIDRHQATGLAVVPVMIERIIDLAEDVRRRYDTRSLRFVTASGSRMRPEAVARFMASFGDVVYNSYNATEAGMITIATPQDLRVAPDTAGRPALGTELQILDDTGRPVPPGEVGQIFVRNDTMFEGYTTGDSKEFHEGYIASGDIGYLDDAGRLYVVGRDDEMIVSGGENVYPLEVEKALADHPAVREAAVVGVDDEAFGQRLAAFVVLENGRTVSADELRQHVKEQLASFKAPRDVTFIEALPRNIAGKVVKRQLPVPPSPDHDVGAGDRG